MLAYGSMIWRRLKGLSEVGQLEASKNQGAILLDASSKESDLQ